MQQIVLKSLSSFCLRYPYCSERNACSLSVSNALFDRWQKKNVRRPMINERIDHWFLQSMIFFPFNARFRYLMMTIFFIISFIEQSGYAKWFMNNICDGLLFVWMQINDVKRWNSIVDRLEWSSESTLIRKRCLNKSRESPPIHIDKTCQRAGED